MRALLLLSVAALNVIAISSATGEEAKQPNANRLKLFCSLGKDGMMILPAEPEQAAKNSTQLVIICDSMRLDPDGGIVLENVTIEMKNGEYSGKELAMRFDTHGRSIRFYSPDGGAMRDIRFTPKLKAEQPK